MIVGALSTLLRAEWLVIFLVGIYQYLAMHGNPYWLLPLLLAPDLSMIGYLAGPRIGAVTYNAVHNLVVAAALLVIGLFTSWAPLGLLGAVLFAHVGMDRALGYGLKLPSDFRDTHLGRIGRG
jgi:hypothetical protein